MLKMKFMAIVVAASFLAGATSSGFVVHKLWKGRVAATRVANLERQLQATQRALEAVSQQYAVDMQTLADLRRSFEDAQSNTSDGVCLPADDADRLRDALRPAGTPRRGPR